MVNERDAKRPEKGLPNAYVCVEQIQSPPDLTNTTKYNCTLASPILGNVVESVNYLREI